MNRFDGQGHHPWIRPHYPHRKKERSKLKVIRHLTPKAWQIAMMKLGIGFVPIENNCFVLGKLIRWDFLISSETTQEEPMCVDMSCGEVGDYAMLEAAPSRPPPKHGWLTRLYNTPLFLFLAALMAFATACKKDPNGADTPIEPTREIVIDWNWQDNLGYAPPKDTIMFYTKQKDVKWVFINLTSPNSTGHRPRAFHRARDTLQTRLDIAPLKVRGSGTIYVNSRNGAHLPNDYSNNQSGMSLEDSIWYTENGWKVQRLNQFYGK